MLCLIIFINKLKIHLNIVFSSSQKEEQKSQRTSGKASVTAVMKYAVKI